MSDGARAVIAGIGDSGFWRRGLSGRSEYRLALDAILNACTDAGIDPKQIDGVTSFADESSTVTAIVDGLGLTDFRYSMQPFDASGGGMAAALDQAAMAIETGRANYVVFFRGISMSGDGRYGRPGGYKGEKAGTGRNVSYSPTYWPGMVGSFNAPFGASVPAQHWALQAMKHCQLYGTTGPQLAEVAVAARLHAMRNPRALKRDPLSVDDHQNSRFIAEPLRLLDCCMESDAAGAVILTSRDRAMDCRSPGVQVLSSVTGTTVGMSTIHGYSPYPSANLRSVAPRLWGEAGVHPEDVDVAQIYDHFTSHVLMAFEDLGFCDIGEGGPFAESGALRWPHGSIPTNTSGGQLSEVYTVGISLLIEAVRQLRGTSTCQVEGAETALVTSGGGSCPTGAMVLGKVR